MAIFCKNGTDRELINDVLIYLAAKGYNAYTKMKML